ncbi:radical SAM protein, partial [Patescibacteria group bacterium]|nr:radical SAM protein [Patescibacteria group bacterium]
MNTSKPIRLSKWAHLMQCGEVYAVFHSLCLSLLFFEGRYKGFLEELRFGTTLEHLRKIDSDADAVVAELLEQQLVVPVDHDDNTFLCEKQKTYIYPPTLETIFMLLTDACNLRCGYCFINGNMPKQCQSAKVMSWDTAKETINMYFANLRPTKFHKTIVFYGGEPLLMFLLLQQIIGYIYENYTDELAEFKIGLLLITNGIKITAEIADYLAKHPEITICISLDGCEGANDQKRVYTDGKGTFKDITAGIEQLHIAGRKDINISATIDDHNIDGLGDLLALHKQYQFQTVNFNLLLDTAERTVDPSYTEHATKRMLEYFEKAREIGLYEDRIMRKVRAIGRGVLHPFDCRATGAQLAISPDGSLGICHEGVGCNNFFFGKVSRDFV